MKLNAMVGYKLFKKNDDESINLLRITKVRKTTSGKDPETVTVKDESDGHIYQEKVSNLKGYTPLEPDGLMTFNIVELRDSEDKIIKDVVITGSKILNIKVGDTLPYCICRQNITDIFYNLLCKDESDMMVGLSVNRDTCPANFDYGLMLACNSIIYTETINFYRTDILDDILKMVSKLKFNTVLETSFEAYVKFTNEPRLIYKKSSKGWCRNIDILLHQNNFQEDINQMLGITTINPIISNHTITKLLPNNEEYTSLDDEFKLWLSSIYKIAINDITVLEYDHDINLAEFNNATYFLLRDGNNKLYIVVYTVDGAYLESDLEAQANKKDFSEEFRINFYNKYNKNIK